MLGHFRNSFPQPGLKSGGCRSRYSQCKRAVVCISAIWQYASYWKAFFLFQIFSYGEKKQYIYLHNGGTQLFMLVRRFDVC